MRWYEYKMETDELHAPDDLKAKLLAMADTLTEEEKAQPMMKAPQAAVPAAPARPEKKKIIHFPRKQLGALAACLAVCAVGYGAISTMQFGLGGAKSSNVALYSANSSAASMAAVDNSPMVANYSLDTAEVAVDNGTGSSTDVLSATDAAAATEGANAVDSAKIIYTANLTLESKDYDAARAALDDALQAAGGYLESSSEYSNTGSRRSVSLTYRVPQENYQSFLDAVAAAGNVTYESEQADDVTTQYMDVETRLSTLEAQRTRLQELQQQADNLTDLLQIESSLNDVQYQIESWQSQLDWYSNQVQQCTVYVNLNEVQAYTPGEEDGFAARIGTAFSEGWSNFVNGLQQLAVTLAAAWPVVVLVLAVGAGAFVWHKKHKAKKA